MIKDVLIRFKVTNDSFKDGNLLLYDGDNNYFYSITPDMFLHVQNEKIIKLNKELIDKEKNMKLEIAKSKEEIEELKKRYESFLKSYQEANTKLLNMVESFIKKYGGND